MRYYRIINGLGDPNITIMMMTYMNMLSSIGESVFGVDMFFFSVI